MLAVLWSSRALVTDKSGRLVLKPIASIAVLPLENLSGDRDQQYFVDGMHEALIADLSKIGALRVISRTSVARFKATTKPLPTIARELGVDGIIEGSVLRVDNRVRITAQLVRADTDTHLWAESYEGDLSDILSLQRSTAAAIARQVRVVISPQERARLESKRTVDPAAHEAYLKGRFYLAKNNYASNQKARGYFEQAAGLDSSYAPTFACLGSPYLYSDILSPSEAASKARSAATRALELDPDLPEAHIALSGIRLYCDWAWSEAEAECKRAIELDPNSAEAHHRYAHVLRPLGRFDESLGEARIAVSLDPFNLPTVGHLMGEFMARRQYDSLLVWANKTLELDPTYLPARLGVAHALSGKGEFDAAIAQLERIAVSDSGGREVIFGPLVSVYSRAGRKDEMLKALSEYRALAARHGVSNFDFACILARVGEREEALSRLEAALNEREPDVTDLMITEALDSVRSDPRFRDFVRRLGLPP
jgi:TolB-like protein/tetratricopeptide (TPR) repeat protein